MQVAKNPIKIKTDDIVHGVEESYEILNKIIDELQEKLNFKGCLISKSSSQTLENNTGINMTFDVEVYDTDNFFDSSIDNTKITIPSGVAKVKLTAGAAFADTSVNGVRSLNIRKNGGFDIGLGRTSVQAGSTEALGGIFLECFTAVLEVEEGDYFEARVFQNSGGNLDILKSVANFFALEVIQ